MIPHVGAGHARDISDTFAGMTRSYSLLRLNSKHD